jgi:hypothetical protein
MLPLGFTQNFWHDAVNVVHVLPPELSHRALLVSR